MRQRYLSARRAATLAVVVLSQDLRSGGVAERHAFE
jgi:hypothetical protein